MALLSFNIEDGPSEKQLFFSLWGESSPKEFKLWYRTADNEQTFRLRNVTIMGLKRHSGIPNLWSFEGFDATDEKVVRGIFDPQSRKGVLFVEGPLMLTSFVELTEHSYDPDAVHSSLWTVLDQAKYMGPIEDNIGI